MFAGSFKNSIVMAHAYGGKAGPSYDSSSPEGCGNAASGTVYW